MSSNDDEIPYEPTPCTLPDEEWLPQMDKAIREATKDGCE